LFQYIHFLVQHKMTKLPQLVKSLHMDF
jgi:hypothetical protein